MNTQVFLLLLQLNTFIPCYILDDIENTFPINTDLQHPETDVTGE